MLGGVSIPFEQGLVGHSDGDALLHAVASAILGALGEGVEVRPVPPRDHRHDAIESLRRREAPDRTLEQRLPRDLDERLGHRPAEPLPAPRREHQRRDDGPARHA